MNDHPHDQPLERNSGHDSIGRREFLTLMIAGSLSATSGFAQTPEDTRARFRKMSEEAERRGLAEPFKGITTDGSVVEGLFPIKPTGVSTAPVRQAAEKFIASLTTEQRSRVLFPIDDAEWRKWMNQHFYQRQGVSFQEMTPPQREAGFGLLSASLSAKGMRLTRDIMRLNEPSPSSPAIMSFSVSGCTSSRSWASPPLPSLGAGSSMAITQSSIISCSVIRW